MRDWVSHNDPAYKLQDTRDRSHRELWAAADNRLKMPQVTRRGDEIHEARKRADYRLHETVDDGQFEFDWQRIEAMHAFIDAVPFDWPRDPILISAESARLSALIAQLYRSS